MGAISIPIILLVFFGWLAYFAFTLYRDRRPVPKTAKKEREGDGPNDTRYKKPSSRPPKKPPEKPNEKPGEKTDEKRSA
jgi:hypothetical protein